MAEKTEFKTVETSQEDLEELEEKIRRHRHKIARRTALVIVTVVAAVIFVELWSALRTYSGFEVQASAERKDSAATGYKMFQGKILEWVAISFSRGSSQLRDQTCVSCIGRQILYR